MNARTPGTARRSTTAATSSGWRVSRAGGETRASTDLVITAAPNTPQTIALPSPPPRLGADPTVLPAIPADDITIGEAPPDPPPGPERDRFERETTARIMGAEDAMAQVVTGYLTRVGEVVLARLRGPKARKGTRWWSLHEGKSVRPPGIEVKALDPDYIVPARIVDEIAENVRPVALRVAVDAAADTARRLGADPPDTRGDGAFAVDQSVIEQAVGDAIARILGVAERHAQEIRDAVLDADGTAENLDEVLDRVENAHRRGGNWVLLHGRTLATALVNEAALRQAIALGCTHKQWLSRRDERVRFTHAVKTGADGQVRPVGDLFDVGAFQLMHPGDPRDLPASWEEIANCRCGMLFRRPEETPRTLARIVEADRTAGQQLARLADQLVDAEIVTVPVGTMGLTAAALGVPDTGPAGGAPGWRVPLREPLTAYRALVSVLEARPGQRLTLADGVALSLAPPDVPDEQVLTVLVPASTVVVVLPTGVVLIPGTTTLEVVAVGAAGVQATVVLGATATTL